MNTDHARPIEVTLVIEPPTLPFVGLYAPARKMYAFDEFASAVAKALGADVPVVESTLARAAPSGLVLLSAGTDRNDFLQSPAGRAMRNRIVLLNAGRTQVLSSLETFGLAGAIESYRYSRWQTDRDHDFGGQVYGKREIVAKADAPIEEAFSSEQYVLFDAPGTTDLATALAWYLRRYWDVYR